MIPKDYECDGQITINDFMLESKPVEYGDRGCKCCRWHVDGQCKWKDSRVFGDKFPNCPFEPDVPRMCQSCAYANQYVYQIKEQYLESVKNHHGYTRESADDPVEDANIYCTHPDGSLNRHTAYQDIQKQQGIGHWHRWHEFDTCDRYEED